MVAGPSRRNETRRLLPYRERNEPLLGEPSRRERRAAGRALGRASARATVLGRQRRRRRVAAMRAAAEHRLQQHCAGVRLRRRGATVSVLTARLRRAPAPPLVPSALDLRRLLRQPCRPRRRVRQYSCSFSVSSSSSARQRSSSPASRERRRAAVEQRRLERPVLLCQAARTQRRWSDFVCRSGADSDGHRQTGGRCPCSATVSEWTATADRALLSLSGLARDARASTRAVPGRETQGEMRRDARRPRRGLGPVARLVRAR